MIDPVRGILKLILFMKNPVSFPGGAVVKNLHANAGDSSLIPNWEDSHAAEQQVCGPWLLIQGSRSQDQQPLSLYTKTEGQEP